MMNKYQTQSVSLKLIIDWRVVICVPEAVYLLLIPAVAPLPEG